VTAGHPVSGLTGYPALLDIRPEIRYPSFGLSGPAEYPQKQYPVLPHVNYAISGSEWSPIVQNYESGAELGRRRWQAKRSASGRNFLFIMKSPTHTKNCSPISQSTIFIIAEVYTVRGRSVGRGGGGGFSFSQKFPFMKSPSMVRNQSFISNI
jgi:hypothetical protein